MINPAVRGTLTRITQGDNLGSCRVSGDGRTVVWNEWVDKQWEVMRYRDGQILCLSKHDDHDVSPQLSDDGDTVVWTRFNSARGDMDVMQWKNGAVTALADSPADEMDPAISGDGRCVAYVYDDPNQPTGFDIHMVRDGAHEVVTTGGAVDTDPLVNHDGSWVFFRRKTKFDGGDLWLRDHAGVEKPITNNPIPEFTPVISGDGKKVAWSQDDKGDHDVFLFECEGSRLTPVAAQRFVDERDPSMCADGSTLAWSRSENGSTQVVVSENGESQQVTDQGYNAWPQLSNDGKTVVWLNYDPETRKMSLYRFERE